MKRAVAKLLGIGLLVCAAPSVEGQERSGAAWAQPEDFSICTNRRFPFDENRRRAACSRLHYTYYLAPMIAKQLRELGSIRDLIDVSQIPDPQALPLDPNADVKWIDWNKPQPDPMPFDMYQISKQLGKPLQGEALRAARKQQLVELIQSRDAVLAVAAKMDNNIAQLEQVLNGR